jgi:DNA-binding MarR family transcriptional regulator
MSTAASPRDDFGILLNVAFGAFKDRLHAHLAGVGFDDLGPSYGYVFRSLDGAPLSLAQLATRLAISPQGAHKIVAEMVERGYVERQDDEEDGRVRRLVLTARGRAALRAARRFHAHVERELVRELGSSRVSAARAVLGALVPDVEGAGSAPRSARPF